MTVNRRIQKLEERVERLQARLSARTSQLILLLSQIDEMKEALRRAGYEVEFKALPDGTEEAQDDLHQQGAPE